MKPGSAPCRCVASAAVLLLSSALPAGAQDPSDDDSPLTAAERAGVIATVLWKRAMLIPDSISYATCSLVSVVADDSTLYAELPRGVRSRRADPAPEACPEGAGAYFPPGAERPDDLWSLRDLVLVTANRVVVWAIVSYGPTFRTEEYRVHRVDSPTRTWRPDRMTIDGAVGWADRASAPASDGPPPRRCRR